MYAVKFGVLKWKEGRNYINPAQRADEMENRTQQDTERNQTQTLRIKAKHKPKVPSGEPRAQRKGMKAPGHKGRGRKAPGHSPRVGKGQQRARHKPKTETENNHK